MTSLSTRDEHLFFARSNQMDFTLTAAPLNNLPKCAKRKATAQYSLFVKTKKKQLKRENELKIKSSVALQVEQKK